MWTRRLLAPAALAASALSACSPGEPDHDVAYYRDQPAERATKMAACRNDRDREAASANCNNALAADGEAVSKRFWTVPTPQPRVQHPGAL